MPVVKLTASHPAWLRIFVLGSILPVSMLLLETISCTVQALHTALLQADQNFLSVFRNLLRFRLIPQETVDNSSLEK